jgi:predicted DnaQ family exonuclease/DinG family helicase
VSRVYVALDLETTGLDPEHDAIIEVGAVRFRGERVLDTLSTLVDPARPIPLKIQQLTNIRPEDVSDAPPLYDVLPRVQRFVGNQPIVGHNVAFDLSFLRRHGLFKANEGIDTFELASILLPFAPRYSLTILASHLGLEFDDLQAHRALDDAQQTRALFEALLDQARRLDGRVIEEVSRLAARSQWSLAPVFQDLARERRRAAPMGTIGQQLAAKGVLAEDGRGGKLARQEQPAPPLRAAAQPHLMDVDQIAALLEGDGQFARTLPEFEHRVQQVAMLRAVTDAFNGSYHLLVEAGTGTGKSLAYLLPALHWAAQNGQRVVISTNTINLQDQLLQQDLPLLRQVLPFGFRAVTLKGRGNYVCPFRVNQFRQRDDHSPLELRLLAKVLVWLPSTVTGDQQELFMPERREQGLWRQVCADADVCPPDRCTREGCFFWRAREAAESAHVIVTNHALLLADIAVDNRVIPEYKYLIIDEAHNLENTVTKQLSFTADRRGSERLLSDLGVSSGGKGRAGLFNDILNRCRRVVPGNILAEIEQLTGEGSQAAAQASRQLLALFTALGQFLADHRRPRAQSAPELRLRLSSSMRVQPGWSEVELAWDNADAALTNLGRALEWAGLAVGELDLYDVPDWEHLLARIGGHRSRVAELQQYLKAILSREDPSIITWIEQNSQTDDVSLHGAPLHVGALIRTHLFEAKETVILTSATLRTDNSFDYVRDRLSAWDVEENAVGSPFDFESTTMLFLPTDIPEPGSPGYQKRVEAALVDLITAIQGRTLVLFTAYSQLRTTARNTRDRLAEAGIVIYEQGGGSSRVQLLENFKNADQAALFGTRSFWEGVDVPGEALSCVAIARFPFAVPSDPIIQARSETFEDPFNQYSVPEAILRFRQGFGRLIRTKTDRGVVVVLDRRIISKAYGRAFVDSLPQMTVEQRPVADLPSVARAWLERQ